MKRSSGKVILSKRKSYKPLVKNGNLAELIGLALGDGHICKYPRTEELRIVSNSNNSGLIERCAQLIKKVFGKEAYIVKSKQSNSVKIGIYENFISRRIGIPHGSRKGLLICIPGWIFYKKEYILRYLRGLYEAEGSLSHHPRTYTHKFIFKNRNISMLDNVFTLVKKVGFNPHRSKYMVQVSRKLEVESLVNLIKFRKYK